MDTELEQALKAEREKSIRFAISVCQGAYDAKSKARDAWCIGWCDACDGIKRRLTKALEETEAE